MEKTSPFPQTPDSATLTPQQLAEMTTHPDWGVRREAAQHPSTPPEALSRLAGDEEWQVRWRVAANPSTPPELLPRLAEDQNGWVRAGVALHPSTPPEILARLAEDEAVAIRERVARHPSTPPEVLSRLAGDPAMARHLAAPSGSHGEGAQLTPLQAREVLELASERAYNPRSCLPQSYPVLAEIEAEGVRPLFHQRLEAARAGSLDEQHLSELVQDPSPLVRQTLATRTDLPEEMQATLAQDPRVAYTVAGRPDLTPEAARIIFEADDCAVTLAQNPACPKELLQGLYEKDPQTAWAIVQNHAASSELLHQIALQESDTWLLRDIAHHPNVSLSTLGHLASSAQPSVAEEARSVLAERLEQEVECER